VFQAAGARSLGRLGLGISGYCQAAMARGTQRRLRRGFDRLADRGTDWASCVRVDDARAVKRPKPVRNLRLTTELGRTGYAFLRPTR